MMIEDKLKTQFYEILLHDNHSITIVSEERDEENGFPLTYFSPSDFFRSQVFKGLSAICYINGARYCENQINDFVKNLIDKGAVKKISLIS